MNALSYEAIEKIEQLVEEKRNIVEVNGRQYSTKKLYEVEPERRGIEPLRANSLDSLIEFVKTNVGKYDGLNVVVEDYQNVSVVTELDNYNKRDTVFKAGYNVKHIGWLNSYIDPEEMIINLRCNCVEDEELRNVIEVVSGISDKAEVQTTDDGIGQKTTIVKGSVVMGQVEIRSVISLALHRTFAEITPLKESFILRVKNGRVALFTANGDLYKMNYQNEIRFRLASILCQTEGVVVL